MATSSPQSSAGTGEAANCSKFQMSLLAKALHRAAAKRRRDAGVTYTLFRRELG